MPTVSTLHEHLAGLPDPLRQSWQRLYSLHVSQGTLVAPPEMEAWITRQFGNLDDVRHQQIVRITNRWTLEAALFNPLRARRPAGAVAGDNELAGWIQRELDDDMFAMPLRDTPADTFGRIEGRFCTTASNIAKYDGWHGLVIPRHPNPLEFERAHIHDFLDVALRWIAAAHTADASAAYPLITWNCLPKSGATIVHSHWQIVLAGGTHYARVEAWRQAGEQYFAHYKRVFTGDLWGIHEALDLALPCAAPVRGAAHITPMRNREVLLLLPFDHSAASSPAGRFDAPALADTLYAVLRTLIDELGMRAFNLAIALPALAHTGQNWDAMPVVARIADRGAPLTLRSDWGAMELYGSGVITEDPFAVAQALQRAMPAHLAGT